MLEFEKNLAGIVIAATTIFLVLVIAIVIFMFQIQKKNQRFLVEKQMLTSRFQQETLRSQLEIQEQTLRHLSQEIHDNIGQTLSLVKLNLNTLNLFKPEAATEKIHHTRDLVSKAITDLRTLSKSLNTDTVLAGGLIKAVSFELDAVNKSGALTAQMQTEGNVFKLDAQKELILFRIVQEALNNIIKHSSATSIIVKIFFMPETLKLSIGDNGRGFELSVLAADFDGGSGLKNMRKRAELIGGTFTIGSNASGTEIIVTVPTHSV